MALQFKSATGFDYVSAATPLPVTIVGGGTGDVDGPASSTDNAIVRFDGATGKLIQNSSAILSDSPLTGTGSGVFLDLSYAVNMSGGGAATGIKLNATETAVGSGAQYLIQAQVGASDRFVVASNGRGFLTNSLSLGGTSTQSARLAIEGNISSSAWGTAGRQINAVAAIFTDTSTAASGTAATAVFTSFAQPTLAATNANVTTTDSATVYIANAPANGTNNTSTRPHALWIDAGSFRLDGTTGAGAGAGTLTNAPSAGDPDKWIPINSDGVQYWMPVWAA